MHSHITLVLVSLAQDRTRHTMQNHIFIANSCFHESETNYLRILINMKFTGKTHSSDNICLSSPPRTSMHKFSYCSFRTFNNRMWHAPPTILRSFSQLRSSPAMTFLSHSSSIHVTLSVAINQSLALQHSHLFFLSYPLISFSTVTYLTTFNMSSLHADTRVSTHEYNNTVVVAGTI